MNYYQEGGPQQGMQQPQGAQVDPQQLQQMFASLPPEVQAEIKKLPQEQQAQVIVAAYQKMQEMLAQQGSGQGQSGQEQAPQGPAMGAPAMAQGGFNYGMENMMNQHMNGVIRMQEGGQAQPNPSSDRMAQLAQAAPQDAQMPQQGQQQMDPEQLKQMFAQLPPEVQQQIQQMPPEQQPQAIMQAYQQMQQQGGQSQGVQAQEEAQEQPQAPAMAYGGANMFSQEVAPESIFKMAKGGYLHDGYMFNSYNTPHPLKGDTEYNQVALMKCGGKVSLVKFGKKKMQTGGPTMDKKMDKSVDKSGSTYKRGDSISGPKTYVREARQMADTTGLGKPMNLNRTNIKIVTRRADAPTRDEMKKLRYNSNQDFKFGGDLPKADFGQFVGDLGKTWVNTTVANLGSSEDIFDKNDFKTSFGKGLNNVSTKVTRAKNKIAPQVAGMMGGNGGQGFNMQGAGMGMNTGVSPTAGTAPTDTQGMSGLMPDGLIPAVGRKGGRIGYFQTGGNVDDYTPYIEAYEGLDDDSKQQIDSQVYGYMNENGIPESEEDTRLAVMKQVMDSMQQNQGSEDDTEEMATGGSIGYNKGQLITYQDGGKIKVGRVKTYNKYSGDIELY